MSPLSTAAVVRATDGAADSPAAAVYWQCNVAGHRHVLEATAVACVQAGDGRSPANRKWTTVQLETLLRKRRSGSTESALASEHTISMAYVQVLLRHADSLRLRAVRRKNRWDGSGNPWDWLSTPVYLQVVGEGLETVGAVRAALIAGSLRDRGRQGLTPRRTISAELWRWLTWVGPDSAESNAWRSHCDA